jgi:predicted metal-dependent hydrolase
VTTWRNKEEFKSRVHAWAEKLDVQVRWLSVRPMRTKWASCSTTGSFNFNAELLSLSRDIGDYVIVHELLHFFVPNHGKLWKSLMRAHLGDYEHVATALLRITARPVSATSEKVILAAKRSARHGASATVRFGHGRFSGG